MSRNVRSVYPPLGVPNMRTELNYPGDESLKLWCLENFENKPEPRSASPAVMNFRWEGPARLFGLQLVVSKR